MLVGRVKEPSIGRCRFSSEFCVFPGVQDTGKTAGDFLLERLQQWHVERIFGYPADGISASFPLWVAQNNGMWDPILTADPLMSLMEARIANYLRTYLPYGPIAAPGISI